MTLDELLKEWKRERCTPVKSMAVNDRHLFELLYRHINEAKDREKRLIEALEKAIGHLADHCESMHALQRYEKEIMAILQPGEKG